MGVDWPAKPNSCMHATTLLLAAFFCCTVLSFEPDPAHYSTPHEAIEYAAWKALKEGKPPCVTVHPIGITLFCIMGQCVQDSNGSSYCQCRQHFAGLTCSVYKGKCTSETLCSPHLCKDNPSKISLYECVCKPGYHVPDSPAFSHCIPDNLLESAARKKGSKGPASAIALPSTKLAEMHSAEKTSYLNFSVSNTTTSTISVFHKEKKVPQLSVVCKTSDFHTPFIEPKEQSKMEDSLFRQIPLRTDSKVTLVLTPKTVERKNSSYNALDDTENQDPPTDKVKAKSNAEVGMKAGSALKRYMSPGNVSITSQFIGHEMLPLRPQHYSKRTVNVQIPTIRRRRLSTFRREQDQSPENEVTLDDLKSYSAHSQKQEIFIKKKNEDLVSIFNSEHNMPVFSHISDKGTNREHITSSTEVAAELPQNESQKEGDEDYEVSQFRKGLNMAPVQLASSEGHIGNLLQGPAAYLMAAEINRVLGGKKHVEHKQLSAEAQDDIIDSLKNAVEASENSKTNETEGDSEIRKGNILVVADKRKRRKSSALQSDYMVEDNDTNYKLSFLLAHPLLATMNRKDISMPTEQHKVIQALMEHSSEERRLQGATYRHENYGRKMRYLQYSAVPVLTWRKNLQPHKVDEKTLSTNDGLNSRTKKVMKYKSSHNPNSKSEWTNQNLWSEVQNQASYSSQDCVPTNFNHSSIRMSHVNYQTFNRTKQSYSEQSTWAAIKNSTNFISMQHMSSANKSDAPESSSEAYGKHEKTKHRHSFDRDPVLFFNVTLLSGGGRNRSASYLVPFAGNNAILISWGVYSDSL